MCVMLWRIAVGRGDVFQVLPDVVSDDNIRRSRVLRSQCDSSCVCYRQPNISIRFHTDDGNVHIVIYRDCVTAVLVFNFII